MKNNLAQIKGTLFIMMFGLSVLHGQNPTINKVEDENRNYLVTKILLNDNNLKTNFLRLNDVMKFEIRPSQSKTYGFNLEINNKKGNIKVQIKDELGKLKLDETIQPRQNYTDDYVIALEANQTYYLILEGEKFKGKINFIWK